MINQANKFKIDPYMGYKLAGFLPSRVRVPVDGCPEQSPPRGWLTSLSPLCAGHFYLAFKGYCLLLGFGARRDGYPSPPGSGVLVDLYVAKALDHPDRPIRRYQRSRFIFPASSLVLRLTGD